MSIKDTAKSTLNRVRTRAFIDQQDQGDKLSPPLTLEGLNIEP